MHPYLTEKLASQRVRDMHQAAASARLARQAQTRRATPALTLRRRRPCVA